MTFDYPIILFSFFIFILIFIFDIIRRKKKHILTKELENKILLSSVFFRLFLAFSIIAMAGPRWGISYAPSEYRRGIDVVIAVDVSRSMDINDAMPDVSRLERGVSIALDTVVSVTGARFAAAVGRGNGYLAVPLTYNNEAVIVFLESIDGSSATGRSTNLESLIEAASTAFQKTSAARKVIILISDGESHSGVLRNAITKCVREGIVINTIAVGSGEGRQIRERLDDPESPLVFSRRDISVMHTTAERTGGICVDGSREDASSVMAAHLLSYSKEIDIEQTVSIDGKSEQKQRRALFIILALIFFAASKFITRSLNIFNLRLPFISTLFVLILFTSCTEGKLLLLEANYLISRGRHNEAIALYLEALNHEEASPYAEYGLGLTLYSLDEGESALKRYANSQKLLGTSSNNEHSELRFRNHYNSGIIFFEEGNFESAATAFREALRTDPKRIEAKRNLELSLISLSIESNRQNPSEERQEQREILFDYLRYEEQEKWKSREWAPEEDFTGPDY